MLGLLIGLGLVVGVAAISTIAGIAKDGSPFRRSWWSS